MLKWSHEAVATVHMWLYKSSWFVTNKIIIIIEQNKLEKNIGYKRNTTELSIIILACVHWDEHSMCIVETILIKNLHK